MRHTRCLFRFSLMIASCVVVASSAVRAADPWDPFGELETVPRPVRKRPYPAAETVAPRPDDPSADDVAPPPREASTSGLGDRNRGVERGDLAPIIAGPVTPSDTGSSFGTTSLAYADDQAPHRSDAWNGLDSDAASALIAKVALPPKSPALAQLWRRLITADAGPSGNVGDAKFAAVRADALYRSGLLEDAIKALGRDVATSPFTAALAARIELGVGRPAKGCELVKGFIVKKAELPKKLQGDALLMTGICAAIAGNPSGAGLAAEFAREEKALAGPEDAVSLLALDAIASGQKTASKGLKTLSLLQYRAFELGGGVEERDVMARGDAALFAVVGADQKAPPSVQLAAAEAAVRANAMTPSALAELYRTLGSTASPEALLGTDASKGDAALRRATLFKAAEAERTPLKKVRVMRALLDDVKRAGLYLQTLEMLAKAADDLQPVPEIGWFAETGIEIGLASGRFDRARQWSNLGGSVPGDGGLRHWQALIDIADPLLKTDRGQSLGSVEALSARGRLSPDLLHRLATVLDANDTNVPLSLWDQANRAPQPAGGYLPETGVLTSLQDASKKKEFGRTVLLVMAALGPNGAEGAHLISLGDSIRALRRAGLDTDARRLSFEALFGLWPRSVSN